MHSPLCTKPTTISSDGEGLVSRFRVRGESPAASLGRACVAVGPAPGLAPPDDPPNCLWLVVDRADPTGAHPYGYVVSIVDVVAKVCDCGLARSGDGVAGHVVRFPVGGDVAELV